MASETYDYIIAGGGTAGAVLAGRLTEDASTRVLLLEAGGKDNNPLIHVPAGFAKLTGSKYDWGYVSVPQRHCLDREIPLAQGRVLGGGGSINAQVFTRGAREDYDEWAAKFGCTGWAFEDVQPYFIKSESNERLSAPWHGTDGPIGVSDLANPHPLTKAWVQAGQEYGLPYNGDFNGESQLGTGYYQTTTKNGRRCSAAVGYLRPARKRHNLEIKTGVLVSRVMLSSKRATGVEYVEDGQRRTARADAEVIVTSGAYGSPALLQRSGIGNGDDLRSAGVEVQHELAGVGENLHDHCDLDLIYELLEYQSMDRLAKARPGTAAAGLQYLAYRRGPLASTVVEGGAFTHGYAKESLPDLQFHFLPAAGVEDGVESLRPGYGVTLNSYFLRPHSRGSVKLRSSDPDILPLVDPNFLASDFDVEASIEGLKQSHEIMSQPSMAKHVKAETRGFSKLRKKDDLVRFVRTYGRTSYHPVGSCAMGTLEGSVVGPDLSVHGIAGLRIADSSVMPQVISSNTQMPTVMIAEKAADLIRGR